jgi:hypothetical protein
MEFSALVPFIIEKLGASSLPITQMSNAVLQECGKLIAQRLFKQFPNQLNPQSSTEDDFKNVIEAEIQNPFQKDYWDGMLDAIKLIVESQKGSQENIFGKNQKIEQGNSFDGASLNGTNFDFSIGKK